MYPHNLFPFVETLLYQSRWPVRGTQVPYPVFSPLILALGFLSLYLVKGCFSLGLSWYSLEWWVHVCYLLGKQPSSFWFIAHSLWAVSSIQADMQPSSWRRAEVTGETTKSYVDEPKDAQGWQGLPSFSKGKKDKRKSLSWALDQGRGGCGTRRLRITSVPTVYFGDCLKLAGNMAEHSCHGNTIPSQMTSWHATM